jgi:hypothetical protein
LSDLIIVAVGERGRVPGGLIHIKGQARLPISIGGT